MQPGLSLPVAGPGCDILFQRKTFYLKKDILLKERHFKYLLSISLTQLRLQKGLR